MVTSTLTNVRQALKEKGPFYVKNMTRNPEALIVLNFGEGVNKTAVYVPPSKYPFNLKDYVARKILINHNADLMKFLATGKLRVVDNSLASKILKTEDLIEESQEHWLLANSRDAMRMSAQRMKQLANAPFSGEGSPTNVERDEDGFAYVSEDEGTRDLAKEKFIKGGSKNFLQNFFDSKNEEKEEVANKQAIMHAQHNAFSATDYHPRVVGIMASWTNETDELVLHQLKMNRTSFKPNDFQYVVSNSGRGSRTCKWATKKLANLE